MLAINLTGVFHGLKYASAQMLTQEPLASTNTRGNIINTASVLGLTGQSGATDYCAAKGAVVNLTRAAALDCAPHGIQVNAFAPSYAATNLTANFFEDEETRGALEALHPFGGLGRAKDLVGVAVWLAGEEAGWVSGVSLVLYFLPSLFAMLAILGGGGGYG
jgi:NAD(P)-dependent dehydrogenase (short-subunit alcohol dehydrogenase family)